MTYEYSNLEEHGPIAAYDGALTFTTIADFLREEETEIQDDVWESTLPVGGASICSAKPKVGKSTFVRYLAHCVAWGLPCLGRRTYPGPVLYLGLEEKRSELRRAFGQMGQSSDNLHVFVGRPPRFAWWQLADIILSHKPRLAVIDPLYRFFEGADYNSYGGMTAIMSDIVDVARQSGAHILVVHHDSKLDRSGGDALLGSTGIFGSVDCHLQLRKTPSGRTISSTQRYGYDIPPTLVRLDIKSGFLHEDGDLGDAELERAMKQVIQIVAKSGQVDNATIKAAARAFKGGIVSTAIKTLVGNGQLVRTGKGKAGDPFMFSLPNG